MTARPLAARHRRRPTTTSARPTTTARSDQCRGRAAVRVAGAVGERRHGGDADDGENRHHYTESPTEPCHRHSFILRRTIRLSHRPLHHPSSCCMSHRLAHHTVLHITRSCTSHGLASSGTSHRARSVTPEYVVARTPASTFFDTSAPSGRYRAAISLPVEITVEIPGDEAVDDQQNSRFPGVSTHFVNAAQRKVPCTLSSAFRRPSRASCKSFSRRCCVPGQRPVVDGEPVTGAAELVESAVASSVLAISAVSLLRVLLL